ncbi:metallophosphoesterase [Horticoccus luteus]|uniref:Metallophosphoesterase n=1 Tax=Horticoccus luteus TaxID=2862869 RepID=A0A8F9XMX8_9BACT|nr:metallophosphoesterase [Horticoccus luteus]QYM80559.1 metallophosphoesterase [Horticoccus luteus]
MTGRLIAVGDIHGCHQEFADLLAQLELTRDDRLVLLGDLINRGPDSNRVIDLARAHAALPLLGNHELRFLAFRRTRDPKYLRNGDRETLDRLRPSDWSYLESMVLTHHEPELNTVFVHGGFLPDQPWAKQPASVVTRIQVIDDGRPAKRSEAPGAPFWADLWNGPPFVVYGHTSRPEVYKLKWSVCLDTACVMGGALTALIFPEKRFLQVRARRRYYP